MSFFGQPQQPQQQPSMFGGQIPPQILQMLMQRMQQQQGQPPQQPMPQQPAPMPPNGMSPVNMPQTPPMPGQAPMMGSGAPGQMNPLASILGNAGGAMQQQGQLNNGSAAGGGVGGLAQILNSLKSQQSVNGSDPQGAPGGMDIMALIKAMQGGQ